MTARARLLPVHGHPLVVEQVAPELDFGVAHRVVRRIDRLGKALRQAPIQLGGAQAESSEKGGRGELTQPTLPSVRYRNPPTLPVSAATWRAGERQETI